MWEIIRVVVLIVGVILASGFFWLGFRIRRAGEVNWEVGRRKTREILVVNLKTRRWGTLKTISDEGIDQMLGEPGRSVAC